MKSKPPAAGLGGNDKLVCHPGGDRHFYTLCFGGERYKLLERIYIVYRQEEQEKVQQGQFYDRYSP